MGKSGTGSERNRWGPQGDSPTIDTSTSCVRPQDPFRGVREGVDRPDKYREFYRVKRNVSHLYTRYDSTGGHFGHFVRESNLSKDPRRLCKSRYTSPEHQNAEETTATHLATRSLTSARHRGCRRTRTTTPSGRPDPSVWNGGTEIGCSGSPPTQEVPDSTCQVTRGRDPGNTDPSPRSRLLYHK